MSARAKFGLISLLIVSVFGLYPLDHRLAVVMGVGVVLLLYAMARSTRRR
jgi:hypothetical protein